MIALLVLACTHDAPDLRAHVVWRDRPIAAATRKDRPDGVDWTFTYPLLVEGELVQHTVVESATYAGDALVRWTRMAPGETMTVSVDGTARRREVQRDALEVDGWRSDHPFVWPLGGHLPAGEVGVWLGDREDPQTITLDGTTASTPMWSVELEDGGVVAARLADGSTLIRSAEPVPPYDPVAHSRRASDPILNPRQVRRLEGRWGEGPVLTVERPDLLELPRLARLAVEGPMRAVRGALVAAASTHRPSAARAVETGRGDCDELSALLAAQLNEAGLPATIRQGWLYVDDPPGWVPHTWVHVAPRGSPPWDVDPALGQIVADAARLLHTQVPNDPSIPFHVTRVDGVQP